MHPVIPDAAPSETTTAIAEASPQLEDLVLVVFSLDAEFGDESTLEEMWPIEDRAIGALEASGLGYIDGNEIGASEYALYFYGTDREALWRLLEPIMRDAPIPLSRVELRPPGPSAGATVIDFADQG